jgi:hypothetical protein
VTFRDNPSQALKFLESAANLKPLVVRLSGRNPSASLLHQISTSILHARLFSENADKAPLEIRPLLVHYSAVNFAKALVLSVTGDGLNTLPQSHGLTFHASPHGLMMDGVVEVNTRGTFQRFNDVVAGLNGFEYLGDRSSRKRILRATSLATELDGMKCSMRDILGHTPFIEESYERTFSEVSAAEHLEIYNNAGDQWVVRITRHEECQGREHLAAIVRSICERVPFLSQWCFQRADRAWDSTSLTFINVPPLNNGFNEDVLAQDGADFELRNWPHVAPAPRFDALETLPSLTGLFSARRYYIPRLHGQIIAEYSLALMGLHALSSIVRYEPHVWTAALNRRALPGARSEDYVLSLIEEFLNCPSVNFANLVICVLLDG